MTSSELKELVKSHFSLVEKAEVTTEKFGEAKDVNGAFKLNSQVIQYKLETK
jgi:hypothetical protein